MLLKKDKTIMINHEMAKYDFAEAKEFKGLMPVVMEYIPSIGESDENVHFMGVEAKGFDSLEVVDFVALMEDEENGGSGSEGSDSEQ